jgi:hypothetical protein
MIERVGGGIQNLSPYFVFAIKKGVMTWDPVVGC